MNSVLRTRVIAAAKTLFMERGYDGVGMREIAQAVSCQPVQVYRLGLGKSDILAEVVIELNQAQIDQLPEVLGRVRGATLHDKVCDYLTELYRLDIQHLPIRAVAAAFGWTWSMEYERRVIEQIGSLVEPVARWMQEADLDDIPARCYGIWSLYYVGYRLAVIHGADAGVCMASITPSLRFYLDVSR